MENKYAVIPVEQLISWIELLSTDGKNSKMLVTEEIIKILKEIVKNGTSKM